VLAQQQQPPGLGVVPMSSDEKAAAESAVRSDPRIRAIVGTGQPRVITTETEPDKREAEEFLAGRSQKPPTRRVIVIVSNTHKAARVTVAMPQNQILAVQNVPPAQVPLVRDDAEEALALAKANPDVRRVVGETLERYTLLEPGSDERVPFAAQVLPIASRGRQDPCTVDRCLTLIFRTENGYLPLNAEVDLTRRTVGVRGGGRR
jgi:hypothetical protein